MIATCANYYFGGQLVDRSADAIAKCICQKEVEATTLKVALVWAAALVIIAIACCLNSALGLTVGLGLGIPFVKPIYMSLLSHKKKITSVEKEALKSCEEAKIQLKELQNFEKMVLDFLNAHPDLASEFNKAWVADDNVVRVEQFAKNKFDLQDPIGQLGFIRQEVILLQAKKTEFLEFLQRHPSWEKTFTDEYQNAQRVKSQGAVVEEL